MAYIFPRNLDIDRTRLPPKYDKIRNRENIFSTGSGKPSSMRCTTLQRDLRLSWIDRRTSNHPPSSISSSPMRKRRAIRKPKERINRWPPCTYHYMRPCWWQVHFHTPRLGCSPQSGQPSRCRPKQPVDRTQSFECV